MRSSSSSSRHASKGTTRERASAALSDASFAMAKEPSALGCLRRPGIVQRRRLAGVGEDDRIQAQSSSLLRFWHSDIGASDFQARVPRLLRRDSAAPPERDPASADAERPLGATLLAGLNDEWTQPKALVLFSGDGHWWLVVNYRNCPGGEPPVVFYENDSDGFSDQLQLAQTFREFICLLRAGTRGRGNARSTTGQVGLNRSRLCPRARARPARRRVTHDAASEGRCGTPFGAGCARPTECSPGRAERGRRSCPHRGESNTMDSLHFALVAPAGHALGWRFGAKQPASASLCATRGLIERARRGLPRHPA